MRSVAIACVVAALLAIAPAPGRAARAEPDVDLRRIQLAGDGATAPRPSGEPARLTIDPGLQHAAQRLLGRARPVAGAAIAVHVPSGRVLAFADTAQGNVLLERRAPAASLFKIVTTGALLEAGHVSAKRTVCTDGGIRGIERKHLEPPRSGKALCAPFRSALGHSRNAVFAQLATRFLMRDDLVQMGARFGFDKPVPFDGASVPLGTLSVPYNDLEFARTAAGFRGSTLSVLGAAHVALLVAHGGRRRPIRILEDTPAESGVHALSAGTARELRRMMEVTVHSGTSLEAFSDADGRAFLPGIRVAGKTGTLKPSAGDPTTSWFIGFAPSRNPEIAVSVLLQNGKVWRRRANELGRDLLRAHFAAEGRAGVTDPFSP